MLACNIVSCLKRGNARNAALVRNQGITALVYQRFGFVSVEHQTRAHGKQMPAHFRRTVFETAAQKFRFEGLELLGHLPRCLFKGIGSAHANQRFLMSKQVPNNRKALRFGLDFVGNRRGRTDRTPIATSKSGCKCRYSSMILLQIVFLGHDASELVSNDLGSCCRRIGHQVCRVVVVTRDHRPMPICSISNSKLLILPQINDIASYSVLNSKKNSFEGASR